MSSTTSHPHPRRTAAEASGREGNAQADGHLGPLGGQRAVPPNGAPFDVLFSGNPQPMYVYDRQSLEFLEVNPAALGLYGYSREEFLRLRVPGLTAPGADVPASEQQPSNGEPPQPLSTRHRRKDGSIFDVEAASRSISFRGRRSASLVVVCDVSERRAAQHHAEAAQRRAEEKYRRIFDNTVEGIFESAPDGRFVAVNPALAAMAGYSSPGEMLRSVDNIGAQLHADPEKFQELRRRLQTRDTVEGFECPMRRKDGSEIWISMNVRQVRDPKGELIARNGTVVDITERKRSELERQVTTEIIHAVSITDNLDDLLHRIHRALNTVLDAKNCFVALHDPATGLFQFPFFVDEYDDVCVPQQMGKSCMAYVFRTGRPIVMSQTVFDGLASQGEVELIGTPSPSWLGVPLRTPAKTIGVLVVQNYHNEDVYSERDLDFLNSVGGQIALAIERKRSEERLRNSEARLRLMMEQLPAMLWTVDKELRFTSGTGAGLARLGLKPGQLVGTTVSEYLGTSDKSDGPIAAHRRAIAGEPVAFHFDWKGVSYACHVEPLRDAHGEVQGAIGMALDVSDRKKLEEQFRQAQKMEAVGRLAGGIAHDFNNLLMVIQGYADLLAERLPAGESLRHNAEQIQVAAQRATGLTQQLLAFSRRQMLAPRVLNVHNVIADMEQILRRLIGEDVELRTFSAADLWLAKADRSQIEQVVMNLAVNARDAMPNGGRLTIESANVILDGSSRHTPDVLPPGKYVMLAVTDSGCGMDTETQAHIFEPFFTTKEKGKGTGLGLATVYGIVKQSGGYIWVYSEPGHGTTFKIYLPKVEQHVTSVHRDRATLPTLHRGSGVVLLVEDEAGVRDLTRQYLEMSGYTVLEAADGHSALELARMHEGPIDLLLTDVVMPGISGRELADRMAAIRPEVKILYMSGYTDHAIVHQGILEDESVLLQKPFTLEALAAKLHEFLAIESVQ